MVTLKQHPSKQLLTRFAPLNELPPEALERLAANSTVEEIPPGRLIFKPGLREHESLYLLDGQVALLSDNRIVATVAAGSAASRSALAPEQPRQLWGWARTKVRLLRIDAPLIEMLLAEHAPQPPTLTSDVPHASPTGAPGSAALHEDIQRLRQRLTAAEESRVAAETELERAHTAAAELERELEDVRGQLRDTEAALATALSSAQRPGEGQPEGAALEAELEQLRTANDRLHGELEQARERLRGAESALAAARSGEQDLHDAQRGRTRAEQELEQLQASARNLRGELAEARNRLRETETALAGERDARQQLAEAANNETETRAQLEELRAATRHLQNELAQTRARLHDAETALVEERTARQQLADGEQRHADMQAQMQATVARLEDELEQAHGQVSDLERALADARSGAKEPPAAAGDPASGQAQTAPLHAEPGDTQAVVLDRQPPPAAEHHAPAAPGGDDEVPVIDEIAAADEPWPVDAKDDTDVALAELGVLVATRPADDNDDAALSLQLRPDEDATTTGPEAGDEPQPSTPQPKRGKRGRRVRSLGISLAALLLAAAAAGALRERAVSWVQAALGAHHRVVNPAPTDHPARPPVPERRRS
ncbi:MAG: hypothetical protein P8076_05580 [Gammaproteobacteria bacterium]